MCNCGNKRKEFSQQVHTGRGNTQKRTPVQTPPQYINFEYTGKTALTIIGNITGTQYHFNYPGTRRDIDYRDIPGMVSVPVLKKVT